MAEHHPLGDIEYLRENLLNSYKLGFPILKELVQNAEDAKATCLDYGWIKGIPDAEHPLLRTPALFMLDNGEFNNENAKSIRYILGGSSKPNQQDSIGKFGLGLKSVFHLCEAFFYIAPELKNSTYRRWDIFNPWAGAENKDEYHQGWNTFSEQDKDRIKQALHHLVCREDYQDKWFIIWIPLRQKSHCTIKQEEDGIPLGWIKNGSDDFFREIPNFLRNHETRKQLSLLLTLLGTINKIVYWENDLNQAKFEIKLENGCQRRQILSKLQLNKNIENLIKGTINCDGVNLIEFAGSEVISESQNFNHILTLPEFPGKFRHIKPHNAIVFSRLNNHFSDTERSLTLRTAVFLPIGKDENIACKTEQSYCLTLHGYFFVDFARTGVLGWNDKELRINKDKTEGDDSASVLKKTWNFHLYNILLNRFLYVLREFVNQYSLSVSEISAICQALYQSQLFHCSSNRQQICQEKQWVFCLNPQGNKWQLFEKERKVLPLPEVPDWDIFSHLTAIAESQNYVLTLAHSYNLRFDKNNFDQWTDQQILDFINNLSIEKVFNNVAAINYLTLFLQQNYKQAITGENTVSLEVQQSLIKLIRTVLLTLNWNNINQKQIHEIQNLINFIDFNKYIYLDCPKEFFHNIYTKDPTINILIVPQKLFAKPKHSGAKQLEYQDSYKILYILENLINCIIDNNYLVEDIKIFLEEILKLSESSLTRLLPEKPDLFCLPGTLYPNGKIQFYSYRQFLDLQKQYRLFKFSQYSLIEVLSNAINAFQAVLVEESIARLLVKVIKISPVNSESCRCVLGTIPPLSNPINRTKLLDELLKEMR